MACGAKNKRVKILVTKFRDLKGSLCTVLHEGGHIMNFIQ